MTNPTTYSDRQECIEIEILQPLGTDFAAFDIDAIADELVEMIPMGPTSNVAFQLDYSKEFWSVVERHALD